MALMHRRRFAIEDDMPRDRSSRLTSSYARLTQLVLTHRRKVVWAIALFPLLFVMVTVIIKIFTPRLYGYLIAEDNLIEYATCLAYLLAALVAANLAINLRRQRETLFFLAYSFLAVGLFVIGMEEISWGQRIFDIETPSVLETHNWKGEINFHNVEGFPLHNAYILVGFYGAFARLLTPGVIKKRQPMLVDLFASPYSLFLYFFLPCALYVHYQYLYYRYLVPLDLEWAEYNATFQENVASKGQEPIELLLSLGFLLFVVVNRYRYHKG